MDDLPPPAVEHIRDFIEEYSLYELVVPTLITDPRLHAMALSASIQAAESVHGPSLLSAALPQWWDQLQLSLEQLDQDTGTV